MATLKELSSWQTGRLVPRPQSSFIARRLAPDRAGILAVYCLDRFHVEIDGVPLEMRSGGKSLAVLKYMAAGSPRVTSRDALIESLWPDCEPSVASNRLRVAMHGLRRLLNPTKRRPELVISQDGAYHLNPLGQLWVDADSFEEALQRGVELERRADMAGAGDAFREAEELYLRDFLEEDLYEDWTLLRRECLRDGYLMLVEKLAKVVVRRGRLQRLHRALSQAAVTGRLP
jgi:DNA-binding SARP family transcriptional activator